MSPPRGTGPVDPLLGGPRDDTDATATSSSTALNGLLVISPDTKIGRRERKHLVAGEHHAARHRHPTARPVPVVDPERIIDPGLRQRLHPERPEPFDFEVSERRRVRRAIWPILVTGLLVAALFVFVFPTRTYLAQRAETTRTEHQLQVLQQQNDALSARVTALDTDAEIERIAREQFDLVRPGERAFAILPAPALTDLPPGFPFDLIRKLLGRPAPG
jgi:cell division protein FtsB